MADRILSLAFFAALGLAAIYQAYRLVPTSSKFLRGAMTLIGVALVLLGIRWFAFADTPSWMRFAIIAIAVIAGALGGISRSRKELRPPGHVAAAAFADNLSSALYSMLALLKRNNKNGEKIG